MKKNYKKISALVFLLSVITAITLSAFSVETDYTMYMSQTRALDRTLSCEYNSEWLDEPVLIFEGILDVFQDRYGEENVSIGNVYQLRNVDDVEQFVCIASGDYVNCSVDGNFAYLSSGGTLSRLNLTTLESEILYSGDSPINSVWGVEDIVFFNVGEKLYHYYVPSGLLQPPTVVENLKTFLPMSNRIVCVVQDNPMYWEAVEASGVAVQECPTSPEIFSEWLNQRFGLHTDGFSEVFQECDVENILTTCGITSSLVSWIDVVTGETFSEYNNTIGFIGQLETTQMGSEEVSEPLVSVDPVVWEFPTNTYFSDNKYTGCTCHEGNCSYTSASVCDCMIFEQAIQCNGYARYMFRMCSGYMTRRNGVTLTSFPMPASSVSSLREFFTSQNMPMFVTSTTPYGSHSFLIYAATDSCIYICEANTSRNAPAGMTNTNCRVYNEQAISYENLSNRYLSFDSMIVAPQTHTHEFFYEYDESVHWKICSSCSIKLSAEELHDFSGDGICVCGKRSSSYS